MDNLEPTVVVNKSADVDSDSESIVAESSVDINNVENDNLEQIKDGDFDGEELGSDELDGGDDGDVIADIDSYQYSSEEIASFNKYVKRSSAAFGFNDVYNDENDIYVDTYTSPDGEEDFPVYSNDDKNTLEAYNPRPSVGFEYDVYGTGSPTTEKGAIYGENYIIPNEETYKYTDEEKQQFDKYQPRESSIGFEYEVYATNKKDSFYSDETLVIEREKSIKLKSSLKVKSVKDSLNIKTININSTPATTSITHTSSNSYVNNNSSTIDSIITTNRISNSHHRVSFSKDVDVLEIENEKKKLLAKKSKRCCIIF